MAASDQLSFEAVWEVVRHWPATQRRSLASQLRASLDADEAAPPRKTSAGALIGAWRDAGTLDDDAVRAVLEEELLRKHA